MTGGLFHTLKVLMQLRYLPSHRVALLHLYLAIQQSKNPYCILDLYFDGGLVGFDILSYNLAQAC